MGYDYEQGADHYHSNQGSLMTDQAAGWKSVIESSFEGIYYIGFNSDEGIVKSRKPALINSCSGLLSVVSVSVRAHFSFSL